MRGRQSARIFFAVGYTQNIESDYKIGDILKFNVDGFLPVMKALNESQTKMRSYKLLNKKRLQTLQNVL